MIDVAQDISWFKIELDLKVTLQLGFECFMTGSDSIANKNENVYFDGICKISSNIILDMFYPFKRAL